MMANYRLIMLTCGFAAILAFMVFLLVPKVSDVRAGQMELQILEMRARTAPVEAVDESGGLMRILSRNEFFTSLAHVRAAAAQFGLEMVALSATVDHGFGVDETTVRVNVDGRFCDAVGFVHYLAGGVYNVRYLTLANEGAVGFDIWFSIFHE